MNKTAIAHQKKIARKSLRMTPIACDILGGMTFVEAYKIIFRTDLKPRLESLIKTYGEKPISLNYELTSYGWKSPSDLLKLITGV
tara:strand:+ start:806 stop:1060 length:255 start_codon:yes stop_codon:yes gene_type:complete